MELSDNDFQIVSNYIRCTTGIMLTTNKKTFIRQRLTPLLLTNGIGGFSEFCRLISSNAAGPLQDEISRAISTNETFFFRDSKPFEVLASDILPSLTDKLINPDNSKIRIWSAGSSTGQEAYSIAMLINDFCLKHKHLGVSTDNFEIIGSDIDTKSITKAKTGVYNAIEVGRGLPEEMLTNYFTRTNNKWQINRNIRNMVHFNKINFVSNFTHLGIFDIIFCRNVMIYFGTNTKASIFKQFSSMLTEKGFLILGTTEKLYSDSVNFYPDIMNGTTVFRKQK